MSNVYVIQEQVGRNILPARRYGDIKVLLPPHHQIMFSPQPVVHRLRDSLRNFSDDDYLLLMGDPAAIGIATTIACDINSGRVKLLKWDKQESDYYVIEVDIYPERRINRVG